MLNRAGKLLAAAAAAGLCGTAQAAPVQWTTASGGNGHWYEFVSQADSGGFLSWTQAYATVLITSSFAGMKGYLATVTSKTENDFILNHVSATMGWLGGRDVGNEGTWHWYTGPESGWVFFIVGQSIQPGDSNWAPGQPDNSGTENYLVMNWGAGGSWNDLADNADWGQGYFVEFDPIAPVPVPPALPLLGGALAALGLLRRKQAP